MQSGLNGIASGKRFDFNNSATLGTLANGITALVVYSDKPSVLGLVEGSPSNPNATNNDPVVWVQKYTRFDNGTDRFAQNIGGGFFGVQVDGMNAAGATNIDGTWIGLAGNAVLANENLGTPTVHDWDGFGSVTGVAAFAHIDGYPGHGNIVTGLWGYPSSPNMSDTTFDNLPGGETFSTCGLEINVDIRHKDPGVRSIVTGHGNSIGAYMFNYRTPATGVKDWTFGIAFAGSPNDDNYTSVVPSNWNGFYTGILIDKIKSAGILMGGYFQSGAYGIKWPTSYADAALRPSAAMHIGDTQINLGSYTGSTFNDGDLWLNSGTIFFRNAGVSERIVMDAAGVVTLNAATLFKPGGNSSINLGSVASAVNYTTFYGAATTGAPALAVEGSDTNISMELRAKGTGKIFSTASIVAGFSTAPAAGGTAGVGLLMSSTTNLGLFFGTGAPTISAAKGSIYVNTTATTTTTRFYINTNGSTTWTNFTSAA